MKSSSMRISTIATPLMIVCGLLASSAPARADSQEADSREGVCSNRTLQGDYGFSVEGVVPPAPGVALPLRGVALTHFNGDGTLRQVDHILVNGDLASPFEWTPGTGTYPVNADCTGKMFIQVTGSPEFAILSIVVVRQGREIHTVVTPPFATLPGTNIPLKRTVTSVGIAVE